MSFAKVIEFKAPEDFMPDFSNAQLVYKDYQLIASGTFSVVLRSMLKIEPYVLKVPQSDDPLSRFLFKQEIEIYTKISPHPNIIRCFESQWVEENFIQQTYLKLEYADSYNLLEYLNECSEVASGVWYPPEEWSYQTLLGIARGLDHLHTTCLVIHRDLKLENILLLNHGREVKICDFGLSCSIPSETDAYQGDLVGSRNYLAPEVFSDYCYSSKSDIYALAVIMYALATMHVHLDWIEEPYELYLYILTNIRAVIPSHVGDEFASFINDCWAPEADDRPSAKMVTVCLENALKLKSSSALEEKVSFSRASTPSLDEGRQIATWVRKFGIFEKGLSVSKSEVDADNFCLK